MAVIKILILTNESINFKQQLELFGFEVCLSSTYNEVVMLIEPKPDLICIDITLIEEFKKIKDLDIPSDPKMKITNLL
jgi:hypothetical protein